MLLMLEEAGADGGRRLGIWRRGRREKKEEQKEIRRGEGGTIRRSRELQVGWVAVARYGKKGWVAPPTYYLIIKRNGGNDSQLRYVVPRAGSQLT